MEILVKGRLFGYELQNVSESDLDKYVKIDTKDFGKIGKDFQEIIETKDIYIKKATS